MLSECQNLQAGNCPMRLDRYVWNMGESESPLESFIAKISIWRWLGFWDVKTRDSDDTHRLRQIVNFNCLARNHDLEVFAGMGVQAVLPQMTS